MKKPRRFLIYIPVLILLSAHIVLGSPYNNFGFLGWNASQEDKDFPCPPINVGFDDLGKADKKQWWKVVGPKSKYSGWYRVLANRKDRVSIDMDTPSSKTRQRFSLIRIYDKETNQCRDYAEAQRINIASDSVKLVGDNYRSDASVKYKKDEEVGYMRYTEKSKEGELIKRNNRYWHGTNNDKKMIIEFDNEYNFYFSQTPKPQPKKKPNQY